MKVRVPFIPLRGQTFFPNTIVGFDIGRDKSLRSLDAAMNEDKYLVVATQRDISINAPKEEDIFMTGVEIRVKQVVKRHEEYVRVLAECGSRVRLSAVYDEDDTLYCDYEVADVVPDENDELNITALTRVLKQTYFRYVEMSYLFHIGKIFTVSCNQNLIIVTDASFNQFSCKLCFKIFLNKTSYGTCSELR